MNPEKCSQGMVAQLREQSRISPPEAGLSTGWEGCSLKQVDTIPKPWEVPAERCVQQDLQPGCPLSIVWQVVCACHISPCWLCLQWHFPALSCHGPNTGAVTTGGESLFVQGYTQGRSCLLSHPEPPCAPSRTKSAKGRRSREGPGIAQWGLESWD